LLVRSSWLPVPAKLRLWHALEREGNAALLNANPAEQPVISLENSIPDRRRTSSQVLPAIWTGMLGGLWFQTTVSAGKSTLRRDAGIWL
jgi:hypothetical protein